MLCSNKAGRQIEFFLGTCLFTNNLRYQKKLLSFQKICSQNPMEPVSYIYSLLRSWSSKYPQFHNQQKKYLMSDFVVFVWSYFSLSWSHFFFWQHQKYFESRYIESRDTWGQHANWCDLKYLHTCSLVKKPQYFFEWIYHYIVIFT